MADCLICGHKQDRDRKACVSCQNKMAAQLREIPEFYALAAAEYWPQSVGSGQGRSSEHSIGLRVDALSMRAAAPIIDALEEWELDWRECLPALAGADPRVMRRGRKTLAHNKATSGDVDGVALTSVIGFLLTHLDMACVTHMAIDDFAREVQQIYGRARKAAREPVDQIPVLECPADHAGGLCKALIRLQAGDIECERCGTVWNAERLVAVAMSAKVAVWQPAAVIQEYFGVPESTLSYWARKGLVQRRGKNYLWSSIVEHLESRRAGAMLA